MLVSYSRLCRSTTQKVTRKCAKKKKIQPVMSEKKTKTTTRRTNVEMVMRKWQIFSLLPVQFVFLSSRCFTFIFFTKKNC